MITSTNNKQIKNIQLLMEKSKFRKETGLFVAEGVKMFLEAPRELIYRVYVSEEFLASSPHGEKVRALPHEVVTTEVYKKMSDTKSPQGVLTILKKPEYSEKELLDKKKGIYLILNGVQDPGNLGTMIRTAEGAGVSAVIMDRDCADMYNPKVIRSTMGSIYRVPTIVTEDLKLSINRLKESGVRMLAAHLKGKESYSDVEYPDKVGIMIGNEGNGLTDEIAELSDTYVIIPMQGKVESLNAAVSAALLMYEASRKQN